MAAVALTAATVLVALGALWGAGSPSAVVHRGSAAGMPVPLAHFNHGHTAAPPTEAQCERQGYACYTPLQIETAYDEQPLLRQGIDGAGQTIVIVDSFGSPTIGPDLATFDRTFGLPAPPSMQVIQPVGRVPAFDDTTSTMVGWAEETTLDVEYAHTMAPGANILLAETPVSETLGVTGFPQIVAAENYVIDHHLGGIISQSFGAAEETFPTVQSILDLRSAFVNAYQQGVSVLDAAGDSGSATVLSLAGTVFSTTPIVSWPASDPLVTALGGTQLTLNAAGQQVAAPVVWNTHLPTYPLAAAGGVSAVFSQPSYQQGVAQVVGDHRGLPDISMSGSCAATVDIYVSLPGKPGFWTPSCGTSEATPLFAGVVALADQVAHRSLGLLNPALYALSAEQAPGIVDVTSGTDAVNVTHTGTVVAVPGYSAGPGYDLASGVGTVNAALFVPELVQAVDQVGNQASYGLLLPSPAKP